MNTLWISYMMRKINWDKFLKCFKIYKSPDAYCIRFGVSNTGIGLIKHPVKEMHSRWSIQLLYGWRLMRLSGKSYAANREIYLKMLKQKNKSNSSQPGPDDIRKKLNIKGYVNLLDKRNPD